MLIYLTGWQLSEWTHFFCRVWFFLADETRLSVTYCLQTRAIDWKTLLKLTKKHRLRGFIMSGYIVYPVYDLALLVVENRPGGGRSRAYFHPDLQRCYREFIRVELYRYWEVFQDVIKGGSSTAELPAMSVMRLMLDTHECLIFIKFEWTL